MAAFIVIALALSLLALATVLRPLWRDARPLALGTGLVALLSAGLLYLLLGAPQALDPANRRAPATLQEAVAQLQAALERNPQQPEGWALLGQAYLRLGDATRAMQALARAARLTPSNPDILTDAAQARALADPAHRFDAQAVALLESALAHNPGHQRARWYLGVAQRQAGRNAEAAATWAPLLTQVDATTAASLRQEINAARTEAGLPPLPPPVAPADLVTVQVVLDPALAVQARRSPASAVFVIAREVGGPPMPVAVQKHQLQELPLTVTLSDADSPMPTRTLSQLREVELLARLSASGQAIRQPGDLESPPVRVRLPATGPVTLRIQAP
ncbi:tetratricopeptide repeat protein [Thermomonas hydrothermalis]|uniref:Cytochrome c-type biogenesis protein CcmH n=1 Tax=Thermomonas hydrothermalis TaxID=213588 RepID=A0A1M4SVP6_9GAMM|nr:tetratricopeptide repeat protein [Thermomonas hydrothermalis]SHE36290.1 cytochrome c-type biogenesis protein CcmH [Thermomonas hydrothermalis]